MSIALDQVTKRYQGLSVVNDVSLDIGDGEFFVLLGPSGSGKSTLLRAVAGLTGVDHGRISLHGRDVTHVSARERGVGLVFQNYALFRHMTVADNIEFALRVRGMKAAARRERRAELLRLVALEGMDERLPAQLSGGQQQRVAVARALAHKPEVLLLDEPFGALDAKIREELRRTIREVQRELGITTVLVTHDQQEAFALADRIGVMNLGRLLEVGKPDDLYARPATRFVATFLGAANLLLARRTANGITFGADCVVAGNPEPAHGNRELAGREQEVVAVLRPEEIEVAPTREALTTKYMGDGHIEEIIFHGAMERLRVKVGNGAASAQIRRSEDGSENAFLEVIRTQHEQRLFPIAQGQHVVLGVRQLHVLATPLSSFTACAVTEQAVKELSHEPLLVELATRMRTRVALRVEPALGEDSCGCQGNISLVGAAVIAWQPDVAKNVQWLLRHGATEVLVLPRRSSLPERALIHWSDEAARRPTLAASASLLRHLTAEAVYVAVLPSDDSTTKRSQAMRSLLDARSEAQAIHGLEMRTELRFGEPADELATRLNESAGQMLVLGVSTTSAQSASFGKLLVMQASRPVLIVHQPAEKAIASVA
jgi:sulfate transport system ATP-binding protein